MRALRRQREIYTSGYTGSCIPANPQRLRSAAKRKLSKRAFTYIDGGAGMETTIRGNRTDLDSCTIVPRVLRGTTDPDTGTTVLGERCAFPWMLAPVGVLELAHRDADLAVARACAHTNTPMIFSSQASVAMETCAKACGQTPYYFQLYWSKSEKLVRSFVERAERCGCKGIVVTLDTPLLGWRTRDLDIAYLPFLHARGIAQYTSDPVFNEMVSLASFANEPRSRVTFRSLAMLLQMARNYPGNTIGNLLSGKALRGVRTFISTYSNPTLRWNDLQQLRTWTSLPVIVKGILSVEDAREAVNAGVSAIVVSNHGGRQVDGAVSSFEMLQDIVTAVGDTIEIWCDSGIRTGSDIFKCLASGARTVLLGRPYVYALALGGEKGVRQYIDNIIADFELTMVLSGCACIDQIGKDHLRY